MRLPYLMVAVLGFLYIGYVVGMTVVSISNIDSIEKQVNRLQAEQDRLLCEKVRRVMPEYKCK